MSNIFATTLTVLHLLPAIHRYKWNKDFDLSEFTQLLTSFNQMHITRWLPLNGKVGDVDFGESQGNWIVVPQRLQTMKRVSYASELDDVLLPEKDIAMPVLIPANFALYANTLVKEALKDAGLQPEDILIPVNISLSVTDLDEDDATLRLFIWCIPSTLMWQQLDSRIDE